MFCITRKINRTTTKKITIWASMDNPPFFSFFFPLGFASFSTAGGAGWEEGTESPVKVRDVSPDELRVVEREVEVDDMVYVSWESESGIVSWLALYGCLP